MWDSSKCNFCGDCLTRCLYVDYDKSKAVSDIKLLMEGKPADILYKCVTCCACHEYCPTGADPFDLILKMQEQTHAFPISKEGVGMFSLAPTIPSRVTEGDADKPVLSLCVMQVPEGAVDGQMCLSQQVVTSFAMLATCMLAWKVHSPKMLKSSSITWLLSIGTLFSCMMTAMQWWIPRSRIMG